MAEEIVDRKVLLSKIGTFFIVISLFGIIVFVASDISRNDGTRKAAATQAYIVAGVQALQTRDAGAALAVSQNRPTPTLVPISTTDVTDDTLMYFPAFCLGSIGLLTGMFFKRISAPPPVHSNRFEGFRKMQQKQREAKAKKEAAKKEKEKKK